MNETPMATIGKATVTLRADGIFEVRSSPNWEQTLEEAKAIVRFYQEAGGGIRRPSMVDLTHSVGLSREVRVYYATRIASAP